MSRGPCRIIWVCSVETDPKAPCYHHYHNCAGTKGHQGTCPSYSGEGHDRKPEDFHSEISSDIYAELERKGWK